MYLPLDALGVSDPLRSPEFAPVSTHWSMPVCGNQDRDPAASSASSQWMFRSFTELQEWAPCLGLAMYTVVSEQAFSLRSDVQVDPALLAFLLSQDDGNGLALPPVQGRPARVCNLLRSWGCPSEL